MKFFKNTGNILMIGFVIAALSMIFMAYKATTIHFDLAVEGDYYQKEKEFNALLIAKGNATEISKELILMEKDEKLTLKIPPTLSQDLTNGKIEFYCLSDSRQDVERKLEINQNGIYSFNKKEVMTGKNYIVKVFFENAGKAYYKEFRQ